MLTLLKLFLWLEVVWLTVSNFFGISKLILDLVRDHIWPNPGFQEQLVLFELCQYAPSPSNGIYVNWRTQLDRRLAAAGMRR